MSVFFVISYFVWPKKKKSIYFPIKLLKVFHPSWAAQGASCYQCSMSSSLLLTVVFCCLCFCLRPALNSTWHTGPQHCAGTCKEAQFCSIWSWYVLCFLIIYITCMLSNCIMFPSHSSWQYVCLLSCQTQCHSSQGFIHNNPFVQSINLIPK